jgi:hypothetical protein
MCIALLIALHIALLNTCDYDSKKNGKNGNKLKSCGAK